MFEIYSVREKKLAGKSTSDEVYETTRKTNDFALLVNHLPH